MSTAPKILVLYIGIAGIRSEDIDTYVHKVASKIIPETFKGEIILIPIQDYNSRVECVDPQYITNLELINKHTEMMKKLQEELQIQAEQIKTDRNN